MGFKRVLIANRGEIALRILRTLRDMNIEAAIIHGREDRLSLPVRLSDIAYPIYSSNPLDSYLDIEAVVKAAKELECDAVHPGYGFLAENADFVRRLDEEGITFIGPSADVISLLGDKIEARAAMEAAGLPTAKGSSEPISDEKVASTLAEEIGYPVIIKAAAGGGEIGNLVCRGAETVGYKGLATFEFLRDANGDFYFLEVNPRVQVEHTVTELITGHNLVELGIRVAQGEDLPMKQEDIEWRGHAIQCRLNAEDPKEFIPSPGRLWECHFPSGFGVRCDTHAHAGYEMPGCFDSLLAKLLTWGKDRNDAISRMRTALDETTITGVQHLIPLHRRIMDEEDFLNREVTIQYIEQHQELLG